jgi:hypothetical protein
MSCQKTFWQMDGAEWRAIWMVGRVACIGATTRDLRWIDYFQPRRVIDVRGFGGHGAVPETWKVSGRWG